MALDPAGVAKTVTLTRTEFLNAVAQHVADGYLRGIYSYSFGDAVMNNLFGFIFADAHDFPDLAFGVYLAFDEGEYRKHDDPPDFDLESRTREMLVRLGNSSS